jgi:hypothetical protein
MEYHIFLTAPAISLTFLFFSMNKLSRIDQLVFLQDANFILSKKWGFSENARANAKNTNKYIVANENGGSLQIMQHLDYMRLLPRKESGICNGPLN